MEIYIVRSRDRTRLRDGIFDVSGEQSDRVIICEDLTTLCHPVSCSFADYLGISNFESFNHSPPSKIKFQQYANFLGGFYFYDYFEQKGLAIDEGLFSKQYLEIYTSLKEPHMVP